MESVQLEISGPLLDELKRQADAFGVAVEQLAPVALRLVRWDQVQREISQGRGTSVDSEDVDTDFLQSIAPDYSGIPDTDLYSLPADMAMNHDHYLYGARKADA